MLLSTTSIHLPQATPIDEPIDYDTESVFDSRPLLHRMREFALEHDIVFAQIIGNRLAVSSRYSQKSDDGNITFGELTEYVSTFNELLGILGY